MLHVCNQLELHTPVFFAAFQRYTCTVGYCERINCEEADNDDYYRSRRGQREKFDILLSRPTIFSEMYRYILVHFSKYSVLISFLRKLFRGFNEKMMHVVTENHWKIRGSLRYTSNLVYMTKEIIFKECYETRHVANQIIISTISSPLAFILLHIIVVSSTYHLCK